MDNLDRSVLKKIADAHSTAILRIHHLRKEKSDDVFSCISGTTAISGAVAPIHVTSSRRAGRRGREREIWDGYSSFLKSCRGSLGQKNDLGRGGKNPHFQREHE